MLNYDYIVKLGLKQQNVKQRQFFSSKATAMQQVDLLRLDVNDMKT